MNLFNLIALVTIKTTPSSPPVALTIAGFDGSGGAGVHADCRAFQRSGVYGTSALTALAVQSPGRVSAIEVISPELLATQIKEIDTSFPLAAIKTGMLAAPELVNVVIDYIQSSPQLPLVVDPVLRATAGSSLTSTSSTEDLASALKQLFPLATLVTPNCLEAEQLLDVAIDSTDSQIEAAIQFSQQFGCATLLKGGHMDASHTIIDVFCNQAGTPTKLEGERLKIPDLHGTGCTLSSLITANLAKHDQIDLETAIISASQQLRNWMADYHSWPINSNQDARQAIQAIQHFDETE